MSSPSGSAIPLRLRSPRSSATSVAPPRDRDRMLKQILSVGGWTLVSRITGFVRDVVIAAVMGIGPVADAFVVALRLPNHFRAIFGEGAFAPGCSEDPQECALAVTLTRIACPYRLFVALVTLLSGLRNAHERF